MSAADFMRLIIYLFIITQNYFTVSYRIQRLCSFAYGALQIWLLLLLLLLLF